MTATPGSNTGSPTLEKTQKIATRVLMYGLLCFFTVVMAFPFYWMVISSFKSELDIFALPPSFWPNPWIPDAYPSVFKLVPFAAYGINSIKIALSVVVGTVFFCSLGGYSFARLRFPGKGIFFALILGAMMVPGATTIIPRYFMFKYMLFLDTHWPLIVPHVFANSFGTFLMRQFFMGIPRDLDEAARIDGCGYFGIYWRIMVPLIKPAFAALAVLSFLGSWNNFFDAVIFLNTKQMFTLPIGLSMLLGEYRSEWPEIMAGAVISVIPVLIVYLIAQKQFVQGIAFTGLKG